MKPQDIAFLVILILLLVSRRTTWFVYAGLASLILAIPLFAKWIFFTGERSTWYAGAFFFVAIASMMIKGRHTA